MSALAAQVCLFLLSSSGMSQFGTLPPFPMELPLHFEAQGIQFTQLDPFVYAQAAIFPDRSSYGGGFYFTLDSFEPIFGGSPDVVCRFYPSQDGTIFY